MAPDRPDDMASIDDATRDARGQRKDDRRAIRAEARLAARRTAKADTPRPRPTTPARPVLPAGPDNEAPRFECLDVHGDPGGAAALRARWVVPIRQPLALISQVQRSGGHLLARLFDGHPACVTHPHELNMGFSRKGEWPSFDVGAGVDAHALFPLVRESWQTAAASHGGMRADGRTSRPDPQGDVILYPFCVDVPLLEALFASLLATWPMTSRRHVLDAYLTASFNAWLDYRGLYAAPKRYVTAFAPRVTMTPGSAERFFADYPDGHLVTIVRHPGSWLTSALRSPSLTREHGGDPVAALGIWSTSAGASLEAAARLGSRVTVMLFDDLVHRTQEAMRHLCARLGLDFHPCLLMPTFNGLPVVSNSLHEPVVGLDANATERHLKMLSRDQLAIVEETASATYEAVVSRHGLQRT